MPAEGLGWLEARQPQVGCLAHWRVWEFLLVHTRAVLIVLETMKVSLWAQVQI